MLSGSTLEFQIGLLSSEDFRTFSKLGKVKDVMSKKARNKSLCFSVNPQFNEEIF